MPLEATMIVVDNSEWMRNGDYSPSRIEAQQDAVTLICGAKTQAHPENTVGLMSYAGKSPEVHVTLTNDIGKILTSIHRIRASGISNFSTGIEVAQLALKHRQNKNQRQRIVIFVGSPVDEDEKGLVRLAKKLKKNNVAVDIVNFGEETINTSKLEAFITNVNSSDNSHLVTIPPGPHLLSDVLLSSPLVAGEDGAPPAFIPGVSSGMDFVDANLDPELALALRISMEEERARQEAEQGKQAADSRATQPINIGGAEDDEEALLAKALAMSMQPEGSDVDMLTEDDEMARALAMSMERGDSSSSSQGDPLQNADFMSKMLSSLPGVDSNDPRLQGVLGNLKQDDEKKNETKEKKDDDAMDTD